jgi:hypothetical protein
MNHLSTAIFGAGSGSDARHVILTLFFLENPGKPRLMISRWRRPCGDGLTTLVACETHCFSIELTF